jgi:hypothetical protein
MTAAEKIVVEQAPDADSPFIAVMKTWARWMTLKDDIRRSAGLSHPQDVKEFMSCGEAVDALVHDRVVLTEHQRWAVKRVFGVASVWRYPDVSLPDTFAAAEKELTPRLIKNVATRRYFN